MQIIEGIGPKMEPVLNENGIATWSQLAAKTVPVLQSILNKYGNRYWQRIYWPSSPAFNIGDSLEELKEVKEYLALNRIETRTRDHTVTQSLYFNDPDGNPLEFYIEGLDEGKQTPK